MTPWRTWLLGAWSALVLVTGVGAAVDHRSEPRRDAVGPSGALALATAETSVGPTSVEADTTRVDQTAPAAPIAVEAPGVALQAPLVRTGKTPDGALAVPEFGTAGWYEHSVVPGAVGASVLAGHVDSTTGPDVFHRLGDLRPGDEVLVRHADGATSRFVVHDVEIADKDQLPVHRIFDQPARPELRLITCGGAFDRAARSYTSNVIVYAHLGASEAAVTPR